MTAKRKKIAVLVGLLVVLAVLWTVMLGPWSLLDKARVAVSVDSATSIFEDGEDLKWLGSVARIKSAYQPVVYDPMGSADPMLVSLETPDVLKIEEHSTYETLPVLTLGGIIWDERRPVVMINDEACRENDVVEGVRILKIERHKVMLTYRSRRFELELL